MCTIPKKHIKYGIKGYILADSANAYCWNLRIYDGTANTIRETDFALLDRLVGVHHSLYMDNFYNSVALSEALLDRDTYTVGTLRKHHGEPKVVRMAGDKEHRLSKGDIVAQDNGRCLTIAWQDNRTVRAISTKHNADMGMVQVRKRGGGHTDVNKPLCITEYNRFMSGVDRVDQMLSYYPSVRKTVKWTKKILKYCSTSWSSPCKMLTFCIEMQIQETN